MRGHELYERNLEREKLQQEVEKFLAKGGEIKRHQPHERKLTDGVSNSFFFTSERTTLSEVLP